MRTYLRHRLGEVPSLHPMGPKATHHPSVGMECPACGEPFVYEDYTTLIPLGPGDSDESRERAREERWFNAVAIEVHFACATGSFASLTDAVKESGGGT